MRDRSGLTRARPLLAALLFLGGAGPAWAGAPGTCNAIASGAWNNPAIWSCGRVPLSSDDVAIRNGFAVTIPAGVNAVADDLVIGDGAGAASNSLTLADSTATLTVDNNLDLLRDGSNGTTQSLNVDAGTVTVGNNLRFLNNNSGSATRILEVNITTGTLTIGNDISRNSGNAGNTFINVTGAGTIDLRDELLVGDNQLTLNPGTASTFIYGGAAQAVLFGYTNITYHHLVLAGSGTKTADAVGTGIVTGNFTVNAGVTYSATAADPDVDIDGNLAIAGTFNAGDGQYNVAGNLTLTGTFNANTGLFYLDGTSPQTITGAFTFYDLYFDTAGVTLANDVTVNGVSDFIDGIVTTGSNTLIYGSTGGIFFPASGTSWVYGNLQRFVTGSGVQRFFPLGDATTYLPMLITFGTVSNTGSLIGTVSTPSGDHPQISTSGLAPCRTVNRWWTLRQAADTVTFTASSIQFDYPATEVDTGANPALFDGEVYQSGTGTWTNLGITGVPTSTSTTVTGVTSALLGDYAIGEPRVADHFSISHAGIAVNCQAEPVTIAVHDACHALLTTFTGTVNLTTATGNGDWTLNTGSGTLDNGVAYPPGDDDGAATYTFALADAGDVILNLRDIHAEDVDIDVAFGTVTDNSGQALASDDPLLSFRQAGFRFLADGVAGALGTQIMGKPSNVAPGAQVLRLQAINTNPETGACEAALTGTVTVEMGYECQDPASCTANPVTVNGTAIAANAAGTVVAPSLADLDGSGNYTGVALDFGGVTQDYAEFVLNYADVGRIRLHARYTPLTEVAMYGASNAFAVRPFALRLTAVGNPGATDRTGAAYVAAGADFTTEVRAVAWEAADDTNGDGIADGHTDTDPTNNADLTGNTVALNFGNELDTTDSDVALDRTLVAPATPNDNPALGGTTTVTAYAAGVGTTTLRYDEVGILELSATLVNDWLGIGASETAKIVGRSGHVGRFKAGYFDVTIPTHGCNDAATLTYSGQPLGEVQVSAFSALGATLDNYDYGGGSGFAYDVTFSEVTGAAGTLSNATLPASAFANGAGAKLAADPGLTFTFTAKETPPAAIQLRATEALDATVSSSGHLEPTTVVRAARLTLRSAVGSELLALPVPLEVQTYKDNAGFVDWSRETSDTCTAPASGDFTLGNFQGGVNAGNTSVTAVSLSGGAGTVTLSAPGAGNTGSADVTGSGIDAWLQYDWDGDGTHDDNPSARASFGLYKGNDRVIYIRRGP